MTPDMKRLCEAAARSNALPVCFDEIYNPAASDDPRDYEAIVRAVLKELREPSEGMATAASLRMYRYRHNDEPDVLDTNPMVLAAMVDHILAEPATT